MVLCCAYCKRNDEKRLASSCYVDSKQMTPARRKKVFDEISGFCSFHWTEISAEDISRMMKKVSLNEIEAISMAELISKVRKKADFMIDMPDRYSWTFRKRMVRLGVTRFEAEHKADENYPIVSAASVYAKLLRDSKIAEIAKAVGDFGSGYAFDPKTRKALMDEDFRKRLGPFIRTRWKTLDNLMQTKLIGD